MHDHVFARVPKAEIPRSVFPLSHNLKTTMDVDYLYPIFVGEALPADTWVFKQRVFGRMTTPLTPLMDNLYLDTFYFAVPVRLVDDSFKKLMGERPYGDVKNDYVTPMLNSGESGVAFQSLYDYLGIPPQVANLDFLAWYPRAYNLIWNEWFRDENLVEGAPVAGVHEDGSVETETLADYVLRKRGKRHDYFTSCLPWPQKGDPVSSPLGTEAPVLGNGMTLGLTDGTNKVGLQNPSNATYLVQSAGVYGTSVGSANSSSDYLGKTLGVSLEAEKSGLVADLTNATASTVNQLREAFAIQHLCEQWARGGTRYIELLRSCFNVVSPDARQQRPEYLGGASVPLDVNTVAQTSQTTATSALGDLASFVTMDNNASWVKSFTEHTIIIGLANIRADISYQQGLPRMFSRRTKFDFYWPALANLGEQAVLNKEIFAQGKSVVDESGKVVDDKVFGYQERWAEYRYMPNRITGLMRSTAPQSLDVWHLAQKFDNLPVLNNEFIEESVPVDRVVAVTDEPPFIVDGWFDIKAARPMPLYSVPGLRRM